MNPLYKLIHEHFAIQNIAPIQNEGLIQYSCTLPNDQKYDSKLNLGKIILLKLLEKYKVKNLISSNKQGFSVNTSKLWNSYGKKIFLHYFDKSRLVEDQIINLDWVQRYVSKNNLDVRYINKFLGILALEIWYRLFITKDLKPNEKLQFLH
jgi:asparagine synthase (glutamine-hydrolysing)